MQDILILLRTTREFPINAGEFLELNTVFTQVLQLMIGRMQEEAAIFTTNPFCLFYRCSCMPRVSW